MKQPRYDALIIGGGIHGAGIARDAAGRGLRVAICEQKDFASATSFASSKLLHGGLRYLEHGDFRLVRDALRERETVLRLAPHIARPLRFVLPHVAGMRPAWMIRTGLWLYDGLNLRSRLPRSRGADLSAGELGAPLLPEFRKGFVYSDGTVDDARLVILNLRSAVQHRATVLARTRFVGAEARTDGWLCTLSTGDGTQVSVRASTLVNAAGPWVDRVRATWSSQAASETCRLVKGSHIVVPRSYAGEHAYLLQNADGRVVFLIPFGSACTLIGTTDVPVTDPHAPERADNAEIAYLCAATKRFLRRAVEPGNVLWSYSGIRALVDDRHADPSAVSRDYTLVQDTVHGCRAISIVGGKLTTYRKLSEQVVDLVQPNSAARHWTAGEALPGGDLGPQGLNALSEQLYARYPKLPRGLVKAIATRHGSLAYQVLGTATNPGDAGMLFTPELCALEVAYLVENEWAFDAQDILWRRTKAGLDITPDALRSLADYVRATFAKAVRSGKCHTD